MLHTTESIYYKIDQEFDTQFYFGEEVYNGKNSGIKKIDYSIFNNVPKEFKNLTLFGRFSWRTKCMFLAFQKYDKFLITGDFVFSYIPFLLFCKLLGKPVYAWGHGIKSLNGKLKYLNKFFYKNISGFFSYGEGGKKRLIELGVDKDKIHVIYNSLTDHIYPEHLLKLKSNVYKDHFNNDYPVLIFIGRLTPQKKLDWIIDALKILSEHGHHVNLIIIGAGPTKEIIESRIDTYGLNNQCWLYGECYDESINNILLYNADLCVSPGNVGLTALHAMSYGVPVISHNNFELQMPEYETIEDYKTGLLYKYNCFEDFCDKITKWLEHAHNKRESIRQNCYAAINGKWNSDNQIKIIKGIIKP